MDAFVKKFPFVKGALGTATGLLIRNWKEPMVLFMPTSFPSKEPIISTPPVKALLLLKEPWKFR
jgi:hypothetical protein